MISNSGRFREDLLSRINLWTFQMPGLRDRPEDIEPNIKYELDRFAGSWALLLLQSIRVIRPSDDEHSRRLLS